MANSFQIFSLLEEREMDSPRHRAFTACKSFDDFHERGDYLRTRPTGNVNVVGTLGGKGARNQLVKRRRNKQ